MKVSINQPAYIPWLGYFERIDYADIHIVLDHVQFEKNSYINRNKIISNQDSQWLTIPLKKGINRESTINKIQTLNNWWIEKHLKSLSQNYSKSPFFDLYFESFASLLISKKNSSNFLEIINSLNKKILNYLGITTTIINSQDLNINTKKSNLILDLCKSQNAKFYLSGINGKNYLETQTFELNNISIVYQSYIHPTYKQKNEDFKSHLTVLDLLFNEGPKSLSIIRGGRNYIS